jgi:flagellar hook-length control protein FliK
LLAASTEETGDSEPAAAQDAVPDSAKEDAPPITLPVIPQALDLAALLALAGQADAARVTAGAVVRPNSTDIVTANAVAVPTLADAQTDAPLARHATGFESKNGLKTAKPEEVPASVLNSLVPGPAVKAPLPAGKIAVIDPQSVTSDPTDGRQSAAAVARAAEKLEAQGVRLEAFSREPALAGLLAASGLGDGLVRQAGANSDKPSGRLAVASFEGLGGAMQVATGAPGELMAPPEVVTLQTTDTMLADTVSYWVSQGVQKAELKLDGFGTEPIEVSISLANGEAQIGFRTDRAEVREVIEGAMSDLKELLASEGLVLAEVSVGTSGQDRSGAQAQRDRAGMRQKGVSLVTSEVALAAPRVRTVSGRTVDLFV